MTEGRSLELSLLLLEQIAAMVVMAFAGFVLGKTRILSGENSRVLSLACIYLVIPCSLFDAFQTEFDTAKLLGLGVAFALALAYHAVFFGASALLSHTARPLSAGEQACAVYNNAGNLIIAVVQGALGSDYVIYTGAYLVVQNLLVWTHGQRLMGGTAKPSLKKVLLNPNILALLLGLLFFFARLRLPGFAGTAVSSLGRCVGPLSMLVIGVLLAETDFKAILRERAVLRATFLRLVLFPLLAFALTYAASLLWRAPNATPVLTVALLCAIGPSASVVTQLAQLYRSPENRLVSSINAATTLFCAVTIPLFCTAFQLLAG